MGFDLYSTKNEAYFRNNVWWWRRLADFVINKTKVVSEEDAEHWHFNDGHEVSKDEAHQIANQLEYLIKNGEVQKFEDEVKKAMIEASKTNKRVEALREKLRQQVIKETGETEIVPRDYPEPYRSKWEKLYNFDDHRSSYPFTVKNVEEFINFCRESNGFRIC